MTLDVAILGATGAVGQRFVSLLAGHPTFRVAELLGRSSAGRRYGDAPWLLDEPCPARVRDMTVKTTDDVDAAVVFSAIPSGDAGPEETRLARAGKAVFTNAKDHRMDAGVPLVIADINPDHLQLVAGKGGFIVADPNCAAVALVSALKPLHDAYGVEAVVCTSLQALSGAGYPGVPSLDSTANVIPLIRGEEEKIQTEPLKILGTLGAGTVRPADIAISATATRVPTLEGHTVSASVRLSRPASPDDVARVLSRYTPPDPAVLKLPTAADPVLHVFTEPDRPQPRKDAMRGRGMQACVGRIRPDPVLGGVKFVAMCSNTIRGAAGCSVLTAELCHARGYLD